MTNLFTNIRKFGRDESGAAMVEYSLLLAIITAGAITTILTIGGKVGAAWTALNVIW